MDAGWLLGKMGAPASQTMNAKLKLFVLVMSVIALVTPSKATIHTIHQDVDLAAPGIWLDPPNQPFHQQLFKQFSDALPTRISEGDTVDLTYQFVNGRLSMSNSPASNSRFELAFPSLALLDSPGGGFVIRDIRITFLDAVVTGGAQWYFTQAGEINGTVSLGPSLSNFMPPGATLSFSGISTHYTVDFIEMGGTGLYQPWLIFTADRLVVIPEPSAAALVMLMVLGGQVVRRSR